MNVSPFGIRLSGLLLFLIPAGTSLAQNPPTSQNRIVFSAAELDNLVAPVALYPDALLAQILLAATYPEQVAVAADFVRARGTRGVDDEAWDISVKAVAHYPPVLNMLARDEDWSLALGQAYASQSSDVMDAVQRLREMAREQGNLVSTEEQQVTVERGGRIVIVPANPRVIYVPWYEPSVVYFRPIFRVGFRTQFFSFGAGFPIGDWLVYDCDWYGRRVYYDGWRGGGWRTRARPWITITNIYVQPRYHTIRYGNVYNQVINFVNLDRSHRRIHKTVTFASYERVNDRALNQGKDNSRGWGRAGLRDGDDDNRSRSSRTDGRTFSDIPAATRSRVDNQNRTGFGGVATPRRSTSAPSSGAVSPGFGDLNKRREVPGFSESGAARPGGTERDQVRPSARSRTTFSVPSRSSNSSPSARSLPSSPTAKSKASRPSGEGTSGRSFSAFSASTRKARTPEPQLRSSPGLNNRTAAPQRTSFNAPQTIGSSVRTASPRSKPVSAGFSGVTRPRKVPPPR